MHRIKITLVFIIVGDIIALGIFSYIWNEVNSPLNANSEETKNITVEEGSGLQDVALLLENKNIIENKFTFMFYVTVERKTKAIKAGTYKLSPAMNTPELTRVLSGGEVTNFRRVTIPEGFTKEDIATRLAKEDVIQNRNEFLDLANLSTDSAGDIWDFSFLKKVDAPRLEGFIFPDTYEFRVNQDPEGIMAKFLSNFEDKSEPLFSDSAEGVAGNYSPYDHIILASLLEKEVQTKEDMELVAGVLYNRLEIGMPLQVDATLAYITGKKTGEITNQDKEIDHPFNTYTNMGLPPEPIANPGLQAINAALKPTPNNYFYYLTAPDGTTHFAETLEEHNANKAEYLN